MKLSRTARAAFKAKRTQHNDDDDQRAYRERPITRGGQVEDVLIKFRVGPYRSSRPVRPIPEEVKEGIANGTLTVHRCNFIPTPEEIEEGWRHTFLHDKNPWPKDYRSEVWLYGLAEDGGQIDLEVILYDEDGDRAPELISELQGCGFSARIVSEPCPKYGELSPP